MSCIQSPKNNEIRQIARRSRGFSLVELCVAVAVVLVLGAMAVPQFARMIHTSKLQGSANDFSGIVQTDRIRSVQDGKFYSLYISASNAFVDVAKSGSYSQGDPMIALSSEVAVIAASSAPNTDALKAKFLPSGSTPWLYDGSPSAGTPITFSARGLPCKTQTATNGAVSGTVCDSAGGATSFWVFFQNTATSELEAVTVSPAGRIERWYYSGGSWNKT